MRPDIKEPDNRRIRYIKHIINLVAKAFLFGNNEDSFKADEDMTKPQI
jgi:hypothetical protein